jgi:branched-chain amino acid transport system substrate-binding protein
MVKGAVILLSASLAAFPAYGQTAGGPVKIGVMEDMSGSLSDSTGAGTVAAVQMAIDDFGGSALGRKIEIVSADHQNKADIAVGIARQWYDQDGVSMIVGLGNSSTALAVQQLAREKKKIDIVTAGAASELTNQQCSPSGIHWTYDTYSLAAGTAAGLVRGGQDTWFFITADYSFGKSLESDTRSIVEKNGGKVLGSVRFPLGAPDFASYLVTAQSSGAKIVAFASAGGDTVNLIKQSAEFGLGQGKQATTGLLVFLSDVNALGGKVAAGLKYTTSYSMDADAASLEWANRFATRYSKTPTMPHAGAYTATMHYLKAVAAAKTTDTEPVIKMMRDTKINDFMVKDGSIREDGRVVRPMLLVEVKQPSEMKGKYVYEKVIARIPGPDTVRPLAESQCPLLKKAQ